MFSVGPLTQRWWPTNGALEEVLKTGRLSLWDEQHELEKRKDPKFRRRSKKASELIREESQNLLSYLDRLHVNKNLGELINISSDMHSMMA